MTEKIRSCDRKRIDGGHNVGPNVADLDVCLMSDDVTLSYNGGVGSSSSSVFTNNAGIFLAKNGFEEEDKEVKMEGLVHRSKGFLPMNLSNPKGESFDVEGVKEGRSKVVGLKEKLEEGFSRGITLGFYNSSNRTQVLACSSRW